MNMFGRAEVELTTADPLGSLAAIRDADIELHQVQQVSELVLRFGVSSKDMSRMEALSRRRTEQIRILKRSGFYWYMRGILKRPTLLIGLALLIFLSLWTPGKILFIQVEGNTTIPTNLILERAAQCGISFGTTAREVRSERMKNELLSSIEQLQWAGVNTHGCVAVISIKERDNGAVKEDNCSISSIVAVCDGVVDSVTVLKGSAVCVPGQVVKAGQTLISGYTDCGIKILAERAEGEVFAYTKREFVAVSPVQCQTRSTIIDSETKYSLQIGKKRINLYNNSGILDGSCVKMYSWQFVTLPGGFVLPIAILTEKRVYHALEDGCIAVPKLQLQDFSHSCLSAYMTAGKILSAREQMSSDAEIITLRGDYSCYEMIGIIQVEEIFGYYGKNDGTNGQRRKS